MNKISDDALRISLARKMCEEDFTFFVRYIFKHQKNTKFIFSKHHEIICKKLMQVYNGEVTHLIINIAPRFGKTELVVKLFSAWCFVKNPRSEFVHLSYSDALALSNSEAVNSAIKSDAFQELWPEISVQHGKDSKKSWSTTHGGVFMATSAGGAVTGFGAGRVDEYDEETGEYTFSGAIIIDDALKPDDARSDTKREAVNERWDGTIKSRKNSKRTPVIVIMQRLHEKDFTGMLLKDSEYEWDHLILPALLKEGTEQEESLWPHKFSVADLNAMKQKDPYTFSGQYQQNPTPLGGGLLKEEYFEFYLDHAEIMSRCNMWFWTCDSAMTAKTSNDPSVLQLWGCEGNKRIYLLEQIRGWWEFPELVERVKAKVDSYQVNNGVYIEAKANGLSLIQQLRTHNIKAIPWKPKDYMYPEDKVGRVQQSLWPIRNGSVWLPEQGIQNGVTGEVMKFTDDFVQECVRFTTNDSHSHDDQIDSMTEAIAVWQYYSK